MWGGEIFVRFGVIFCIVDFLESELLYKGEWYKNVEYVKKKYWFYSDIMENCDCYIVGYE